MGSTVPGIDPGVQQRLTLRFGSDVNAWFEELPGLLTALAEKWRFELGSQIPRGSVATDFPCPIAVGLCTNLKASSDRKRLAFEAAALRPWHTEKAPTVIER